MLEVTGERVIEKEYSQTLGGYVIYMMHIASYEFAEPYCARNKVLDFGCGSGYGSHRLAKVASEVTAVDVSQESINYAKQHHSSSNLKYQRIDSRMALPFDDGTFDVIVSFQVIEHVEDHDFYLREAARVLSDSGVLLLITPDRSNRLFKFQKPWNRFHLREYDIVELSDLAKKYFPIVEDLFMTGDTTITDVELKRYRLTKWITLPFTHLWVPESIRLKCLHALYLAKNHLTRKRVPSDAATIDYGFGSEAISIGNEQAGSLNLVVVASHGQTL